MKQAQKSNLPKILNDLADAEIPISACDLAQKHNLSEDFLEGVLVAYAPLGLLQQDDTGVIQPPLQRARPMLRSLALCIEDDIVLIDDWERAGTKCSDGRQILDRGVCLLSAIEHKRVDLGSARPSQITHISKVIIKKSVAGEEPTVLMMLNQNSGRYELIGGKARRGEVPDKTLHREISEEISTPLRNGQDYVVAPIGVPVEVNLVSPTTGAFTRFIVQLFSVYLHKEISISPGQRWVSLAEISAGKTDDDHPILPTREEDPDFFSKVKKAPISFTQAGSTVVSDAGAIARETGSDQNSGSWIRAVLSIVILLVVTVGATVVISKYVSNPAVVFPLIGCLLILIFSIVARMFGWINGEQLIGFFQSSFERLSPSAKSRVAPKGGGAGMPPKTRSKSKNN